MPGMKTLLRWLKKKKQKNKKKRQKKKKTHHFAVQVYQACVVWQFFRFLDIQVMISFSFCSWILNFYLVSFFCFLFLSLLTM